MKIRFGAMLSQITVSKSCKKKNGTKRDRGQDCSAIPDLGCLMEEKGKKKPDSSSSRLLRAQIWESEVGGGVGVMDDDQRSLSFKEDDGDAGGDSFDFSPSVGGPSDPSDFPEVKIKRVKKIRSSFFRSSHLWASFYARVKQAVPWRRKQEKRS
ncbi:hypothetical protein U1Q18_006929 [Sarracenia purpurea var. burkii]